MSHTARKCTTGDYLTKSPGGSDSPNLNKKCVLASEAKSMNHNCPPCDNCKIHVVAYRDQEDVWTYVIRGH